MGYQIELRHLHYFAVLSEELHFRRAADRLFISQPGLSKQIKLLEDALGVPLLVRDRRSVKLTSAGEYLSGEVRQLSKYVDDILSRTRLIHSGLKGNLKMGYIGSAMQNIIPELLKKLTEHYPDIQFDLAENGNQLQIEKLLHREIDLGFVRTDRVPHPLQSRRVFDDTFSLVLPKDHSINDAVIRDISVLREEKFILFEASYSQSYYEKVMNIFSDAGFTPKVAHHTIHASSIYRLVQNGFGISIVPTALKWGYNLDIKFVELVAIPQRATLSAIWNPENRNPIMENVIQLIDDVSESPGFIADQ